MGNTNVICRTEKKSKTVNMAENDNVCDFCPNDFFKLQILDLSPSIELDVIPESKEEPESTKEPGPSKELKKIAKRLKPKKEFTNKEKKLRKIMKDLIVLLGNGVIAKVGNICFLSPLVLSK